MHRRENAGQEFRILAVLLCTFPFFGGSARAGEAAITCTNPASGASWQIKIDYDRGTVDTNPAHIDAATISWHDPKDSGYYTLDRKSGKLVVVIASSTGGYSLFDRCKLDD